MPTNPAIGPLNPLLPRHAAIMAAAEAGAWDLVSLLEKREPAAIKRRNEPSEPLTTETTRATMSMALPNVVRARIKAVSSAIHFANLNEEK